jgi:hypothetical protein
VDDYSIVKVLAYRSEPWLHWFMDYHD